MRRPRGGHRRGPRGRARGGPRVVDARRDRPDHRRARTSPRSTRPSSGCCATCASGRGLAEDARPGCWPSSPSSAASPPPLSAERGRARAATLLRWLADDHFTFLGYREYQLEREDERRAVAARASPAPASASCAPTRTQSAAFRQAARPRSRERAQEKKLLVLAKANSARRCTARRTSTTSASRRSTTTGEVVGERRFLGLFSAAAYTESVHADPAAAREGRRGARRGRLRPAQPRRQGADGHPRELPARRAVPHARRGAGADRARR